MEVSTKRSWLIRHEHSAATASLQEQMSDQAFRIFAATLTLTHLQHFLRFVHFRALALAQQLGLLLAAVMTPVLTAEALATQQTARERSLIPRLRPLTLRPAAPHLAPPA